MNAGVNVMNGKGAFNWELIIRSTCSQQLLKLNFNGERSAANARSEANQLKSIETERSGTNERK